MRLSDAQKEFSFHIGCLLVHIGKTPNHACTVGDFFRDPRVHGHLGQKKSYSSANSRHKEKLAADINLFINDQYQTTTEAHKPFGEYWESLHPDNVWGGAWDDGNHYQRNWP